MNQEIPEGATHQNNLTKIYYKFTLQEVLIYNYYSKIWVTSASFTTSDIKLSCFKAVQYKSLLTRLIAWWKK